MAVPANGGERAPHPAPGQDPPGRSSRSAKPPSGSSPTTSAALHRPLDRGPSSSHPRPSRPSGPASASTSPAPPLSTSTSRRCRSYRPSLSRRPSKATPGSTDRPSRTSPGSAGRPSRATPGSAGRTCCTSIIPTDLVGGRTGGPPDPTRPIPAVARWSLQRMHRSLSRWPPSNLTDDGSATGPDLVGHRSIEPQQPTCGRYARRRPPTRSLRARGPEAVHTPG
jgi:hypothetical protein